MTTTNAHIPPWVLAGIKMGLQNPAFVVILAKAVNFALNEVQLSTAQSVAMAVLESDPMATLDTIVTAWSVIPDLADFAGTVATVLI